MEILRILTQKKSLLNFLQYFAMLNFLKHSYKIIYKLLSYLSEGENNDIKVCLAHK